MARLAMIAAVARNGVIGSDQTIPWRIPSDFAWFKRQTMGKPIIMGRKQYETLNRALPGRTNIVATRQADFKPAGVVVMPSLEAAIAEGQAIAARDGVDEVMIVGGGNVYAQLMPLAERLYISHVELDAAGDVVFPPIDPDKWQVIDEPAVFPDPRDEAAYRVKVYARR